MPDHLDFEPVVSQIPGPRGRTGAAAVAPSAPVAKKAYTLTTAPFTMPNAGASVSLSVEDTEWIPVGLNIFVETAGYFSVSAVPSALVVTVTAIDLPTNAVGGTTIATGQKVCPGSSTYYDQTTLDAYGARILALESAPGKNRNFYAGSAPSGANLNDLWFDTSNGFKMYRWDGAAWVSVQKVLEAGDFGSGIRPVRYYATFAGFPGTATAGDHAYANDTKKLYRWDGTSWTTAVEGSDIVGTIDGSLVANLTAGSFAFGIAIGDKLSASDVIIRNSAQVGAATITDAAIETLSAGKITAGDMQAVNIGYAGRIFHPLYSTGAYAGRYFRAMDFGTIFEDPKSFVAGNCLLSAYGHGNPVIAYGPGHPGWTTGCLTGCPDSDGRMRVMLQGRILGYSGALLLYCQVNALTPVALAAKSSTDGEIHATRFLSGLTPTDQVRFFVAPAAGDGTIVVTSARFELDVTVFNW